MSDSNELVDVLIIGLATGIAGVGAGVLTMLLLYSIRKVTLHKSNIKATITTHRNRQIRSSFLNSLIITLVFNGSWIRTNDLQDMSLTS